ncbi:PaaI family thioesterase [Williamsia sp.]|uniref:PaaI family thioesterase n=1 Tax=Williamsia sp. TaxID=1872085 RepID=UPI0025D4A4BA|nr:PaaI family thioesterase [Williamsia sp.]
MTPRPERSYSWDPPGTRATSELRGLDQVKAQISGELPLSPAASTLDYHPVDAGEGWAVIEVEPREFHCNANGTVQGGVIAAVIDSAFGSAVMTVNTENRRFTTLDLSCRYIRPISPDSGAVRVRAEVEHQGRTTTTVRAEVRDGAGVLVASATSTLLMLS